MNGQCAICFHVSSLPPPPALFPSPPASLTSSPYTTPSTCSASSVLRRCECASAPHLFFLFQHPTPTPTSCTSLCTYTHTDVPLQSASPTQAAHARPLKHANDFICCSRYAGILPFPCPPSSRQPLAQVFAVVRINTSSSSSPSSFPPLTASSTRKEGPRRQPHSHSGLYALKSAAGPRQTRRHLLPTALSELPSTRAPSQHRGSAAWAGLAQRTRSHIVTSPLSSPLPRCRLLFLHLRGSVCVRVCVYDCVSARLCVSAYGACRDLLSSPPRCACGFWGGVAPVHPSLSLLPFLSCSAAGAEHADRLPRVCRRRHTIKQTQTQADSGVNHPPKESSQSRRARGCAGSASGLPRFPLSMH